MSRLFLLFAAFIGLVFPTLSEAKRVALVIANARYAKAGALRNPPADARLIAASLRQAGFTQVDLRSDLDKSAMEAELRAFGRKAEGADVALIYYAGHGIEASGTNYLIPTDARLERDRDLDVEATRLDTVLRMGEPARLRLVILDACRNNPFLASMQRGGRSRSLGRGLAAIEPEGETLVVYAAKAGEMAADGDGANSPFAQALAKRLVQPGLEIGLLFRAVRDDVLKATGREQEPFTYGSLSGTAFYFLPPAPQIAIAPRPAPVPVQKPATVPPQQTQPKPVAIATPQPAAPATGAAPRLDKRDNGRVPNFTRVFQANGSAIAPAPNADTLYRRFSFAASPAIREQARQFQLGFSSSTGGDFHKQQQRRYPKDNPFASMSGMIEQFALSTDNAVDAALVFFEVQRKLINPASKPVTPAQLPALRRQLATAMARDPFFSTMSPADLQEASDRIWLNAIQLQGIDEQLKTLGRQTDTDSRRNMVNVVNDTFGFDIRTVRVTDQGYSR